MLTIPTTTFDGWPGLEREQRLAIYDIADKVFSEAETNRWALGFWTCAIHYFSPSPAEMFYVHTTDRNDYSKRISPVTLRRTHIAFMRQAKQRRTALAVQTLETIKTYNFPHYMELVTLWHEFCDRRHKRSR